jgi:hypothetical protein
MPLLRCSEGEKIGRFVSVQRFLELLATSEVSKEKAALLARSWLPAILELSRLACHFLTLIYDLWQKKTLSWI